MLGPPTNISVFSRSIWCSVQLFAVFFVLSGEIRSRRSGNKLASYIFTVRSRYGFSDSTQVEKEETTSKGHTHTHTEERRREFSGTPLVIVARKIWKCSHVSCLSPPVRKTRELSGRPFSVHAQKSYFSRSHFELSRWVGLEFHIISSLRLVSLDFSIFVRSLMIFFLITRTFNNPY